jgi:putative endonuclease
MLQRLFSWSPITKLTPKRETGDWAEMLAAEELIKKKYQILERNWTHVHDELDIIANEDGQVVFVEVRARTEDAKVPGYFSLTKKKKTALRRAIMAYLRTRPECGWRFDVIEISYKNRQEYELHHYEGVRL